MRRDLLRIAAAGIETASASRLLPIALDKVAPSSPLRVPSRRITLIAAGKAAGAMAACAVARFGDRIGTGVVAATHRPSAPWPPDIEWFEASHPAPNADSVRAGTRAMELARRIQGADVLLVLLSGGASALLAVPADGLTLNDKVETTRLLLQAGAEIDRLNTVRKHLSGVKGGRLAAASRGDVITLAISDVVGPVPDDPSVIASGPTVPDATTFADALRVIDGAALRAHLPAAVLSLLERGARGGIAETPKPGDSRLARSSFHVIGSRLDAIAGARGVAEQLGYSVRVLDAPVIGEARLAAARFLDPLDQLARHGPHPACLISAGETTVRVRGRGRGGRNQEFALALVEPLARRGGTIAVASLGTDGIDGPTDAAGAIVDSHTTSRAAALGLPPPAAYLEENDSYAFFDLLGDLIRTGPTDTNVGDLQIALVPGSPSE